MGVIEDTSEGDGNLLLCWTDKTSTNFILSENVTISGSANKPEYPLRVVENLIDGLYGRTMNECYLSMYVPNPYLLLDFSIRQHVSVVHVRGQNSDNIAIHFESIEVRIGNTSSSGDFSSYELIGIYEGPTNIVDLDVTFGNKHDIRFGRYISIQMMLVGGFEMQVCHLEVY